MCLGQPIAWTNLWSCEGGCTHIKSLIADLEIIFTWYKVHVIFWMLL
jgi:hypothetical protein